MNDKITVLDIGINFYTAKQAMKQTMQYMKTEPLNVIEMITADTLMCAREDLELRENLSGCDMVFAGEKEVLEAAGVTEKGVLKEAEESIYLKLFLHYLHKNRLSVFVLAEEEPELKEVEVFLKKKYKGIHIAGMRNFANDSCSEDMIINAVNGSEADCVIALLLSPFQQAFVIKNRNLLNTRVWLGVGKLLNSLYKDDEHKGRLVKFIMRHIFRREMEKRRKEIQMQE